MKIKWKVYAFWIAITEAVGALSGLFTRSATKEYQATVSQPPLSPPPILFPIVWTILYALMGISAARIRLSTSGKNKGINIYIAQLIVNFFWSLIFFNAQAYGFALVWLIGLWILILLMILSFWTTDQLSALLQLPYLLWVTFAGYLNWGVWRLN